MASIFERNPVLPRVIIILAALLACLPLLRYGAIDGDDLDFHRLWIKYFTAQLAQGDLYPRWLMGMNYGAGSPVFYFYAPLAYYIAALPGLLFPPIDITAQHAIAETALLALSGLAFHHYARPRFGALPAVSAAIVYMVLPYHYEIDLWMRQDLSEFANYIWLPLVLHYTERLFEDKEALTGLAISYAAMMATHLPTALLFSLCLGAYVLVLLLPRPSWRLLARFCAAIALGILLAAIYWVPAVFCLKYIHAEAWWTPNYDFHLWFLPPSHPVSPLIDTAMIAHLFYVLPLTTAIFVLCWLNALHLRKEGNMKKLWASLALAIVAWFFMTSWSSVLWETLPLLRKVQFPWRIAIALDLATAIALSFMMSRLHTRRQKPAAMIMMTAAVIGILIISLPTAIAQFIRTPEDVKEYKASIFQALRDLFIVGPSADPQEYRPRWWNPEQAENNNKVMSDLIANNYTNYDRRNGRITLSSVIASKKVTFDIDLQKDTALTIHRFYFPNWRASIADSDIPLKITPAINTGLIQIDAPAGKYRLRLQRVLLREEKIGIALSCLALSSLLGRAIWLRRRNRQRK